tara:strand:+ start:72 stop:1286 length:1215 start_codon:yes stop_codon:yes gene_type:complete
MPVKSEDYLAKGLNTLGTKDLFAERTFYKVGVYPLYGPQPLDLWYDVPLYGKIDHEGDAVFWTGDYGKVLSKENKSSVPIAPDFVAEAFEDLRNEFKNSSLLNNKHDRFTDPALKELKAVKGYVDVNQAHRTYIQNFHDLFSLEFLKQKGREQRMTTFHDYLKLFVEAAESIMPSLPLTKTGYILSRNCNNRISGLMVEIDSAPAGNEYIKHKNYIKNGNFNMYRNYARKRGFLLDKNAPWKLIADITTPEMKKYMASSGVSTEDLFEKYYEKAHRHDIGMLKIELFEFYNQYVQIYPSFQKVTPGKNSSTTCLIKRKPISQSEFENLYDDNFWLKLYLHLRVRENSINMGQAQFDAKVRNARKLFQYKGLTEAVDYINMEVRRFTERTFEGEGTRPGGHKLVL